MKKRKFQILVPMVIIIAWLIVSSIGGPTFGKINNVTTNNQAAFLPKTADSTIVANDQSSFYKSNSVPIVVLLSSNNQINKEQLKSLTGLNLKLGKLKGLSSANNSVIGPIFSKDGKAVQFIANALIKDNINTTVASIKTLLKSNVSNSFSAYVTGPGGLEAALVNSFSGINGILLFVAVGTVFFILLLVYRSIILPIIVLLTSVFALSGAILIVYLLALHNIIQLNGQSQGILSILVIGASTDYSLLLIARFKEYLHKEPSKWIAISKTIKVVVEPIGASAATVSIALLCLLFSDLNSNRSLGPIASIGIVLAFVAVMTLLPAILVLFGRKAFWPFEPKIETTKSKKNGLWDKISNFVEKSPRKIWLTCLIVLLGLSIGLTQLNANGVAETASILGKSNAVTGQKVLSEHFPGGTGSPVEVITPVNQQTNTIKILNNFKGLVNPVVFKSPINRQPVIKNGNVLINVTLNSAADSRSAQNVIVNLRNEFKKVSPNILVGGTTAIALDTNNTAKRDLKTIIPIVLIVIFVILLLLLRAVIAPLVLILSVIVSFSASLGLSALVFKYLFNFAGSDPSVPLFGFIFLVALGVDYNIFLMSRIREESKKKGTHRGIFKGLSVTGGVITSAGVVLAATFATLSVIPVLFLVQISFIVASGVLIDTIIVRSLLVPGVIDEIGKFIWWPSKLWKNGKD